MVKTLINDEVEAIHTVIALGERFGYGNLISHLRTAWAKTMLLKGHAKNEEDAKEMTHGGSCMPFKMHEDLLSGFWDETGESYK